MVDIRSEWYAATHVYCSSASLTNPYVFLRFLYDTSILTELMNALIDLAVATR